MHINPDKIHSDRQNNEIISRTGLVASESVKAFAAKQFPGEAFQTNLSRPASARDLGTPSRIETSKSGNVARKFFADLPPELQKRIATTI